METARIVSSSEFAPTTGIPPYISPRSLVNGSDDSAGRWEWLVGDKMSEDLGYEIRSVRGVSISRDKCGFHAARNTVGKYERCFPDDLTPQTEKSIGSYPQLPDKASLLLESTLQTLAPRYGHPPPSYTDAVNDFPPDYATIAPFARQKNLAQDAPATRAKKPHTPPSSLLVDPACDVGIDWENPAGIREHKKKKPAAKKATPAPQSSANNAGNDDQADEGGDDGGDGGGDGDGAGDGNGDDGGGDDGDGDGWDDWTTPASKKKDKKKKKEEEEQKAKEEEEAKAGGGNNLSWADEMDGGDDSWAGFATVGKKKKKGKVCSVDSYTLYRFSNCPRASPKQMRRAVSRT